MKLKILLILAIGSTICFSQNLEQGLVAYYPFNGNANDESSFDNHGIVQGPVLTDDISASSNSAYFFDGNDDVISVLDNPNLFLSGDFTLSAYVFLLEQKSQEIIRKGPVVNGPNTSPYQLAFSATGDIIFRVITFEDDQDVRLTGYELNTWQLLTAIREGNEMRLYVNGILVGTNVVTGVMVDEDAPLLIGSRLQLQSSTVHGNIDEVRIYNRAITPEEIEILIPSQLSLDDVSLENVKLYPNPAKNNIQISSNQIIDRLTIVDINGRQLNTIEILTKDYSLDVSDLSKGVYFLEILSGDSKITKKFIKN